MGRSSSSNKSSQTTNNTSTNLATQGDNLGIMLSGDGNQITDGGAFEVVGRLVGELPTVVDSAFRGVTDVAQMGERQTEMAFNTATDLFGESSDSLAEMANLGANVLTDAGEYMHSTMLESFDFGRDSLSAAEGAMDAAIEANALITEKSIAGNLDLTTMVAGALENANNNNADLAGNAMANSAELAFRSMDNNAFLVESLADKALSNAENVNKDATGQLIRGFESMMGFADDYSRSDGAALAESNNKTLLYTVGGLSAVAIAVALIMRGK